MLWLTIGCPADKVLVLRYQESNKLKRNTFKEVHRLIAALRVGARCLW